MSTLFQEWKKSVILKPAGEFFLRGRTEQNSNPHYYSAGKKGTFRPIVSRLKHSYRYARRSRTFLVGFLERQASLFLCEPCAVHSGERAREAAAGRRPRNLKHTHTHTHTHTQTHTHLYGRNLSWWRPLVGYFSPQRDSLGLLSGCTQIQTERYLLSQSNICFLKTVLWLVSHSILIFCVWHN